MRANCKLLVIGAALGASGCFYGVHDGDVLASRDAEITIEGYAPDADDPVVVWCDGGSGPVDIAVTRAGGAKTEISDASGHKYSVDARLPEACWTCEDCDDVTVVPTGSRLFRADLGVKVDGANAAGSSRAVYEDCMLPNKDSLRAMAACGTMHRVSIQAERSLVFTLSQAAMVPYYDGIDHPSEDKAVRDAWWAGIGYEEQGFWFGKDRRYGFQVAWEAALALDQHSGTSAILTFAGSEPMDFKSAFELDGDLGDWYFDSWVELVSVRDAEFGDRTRGTAPLEDLCEQYNCRAHAGFLTYASNLVAHSQWNGMLVQLLELRRQGVQRLYLTGHSLGGALATMTAAYLEAMRSVEPGLPEVTLVMTYGTPASLGDAGFAALYQELGLFNKTFHVARETDPGPRFLNPMHPCEDPQMLAIASETLGISVETAAFACWTLAEGTGNSEQKWLRVRGDYVPAGLELLLSDQGLEFGDFRPWDRYELDAHLLAGYMQLISDCELDPACSL